MQKIRFFTGLFFFLGMASVTVFIGVKPVSAQAISVNNIDMVQTDKYMYMSNPSEGAVYIFDNNNNGTFVKKISVDDSGSGTLELLVYDSITVTSNHYVLVARSESSMISVISEQTLLVGGFIQTPKNPFDMAYNDGYLLVSVSKSDGNNFLPFSIQIGEGGTGMPERTPGTADYQWEQSDIANMVFLGDERLFVTSLNNLEVFGTISSGLDVETFYVTSGIPSFLSSGSTDIDSYPYSDYVVDSNGSLGFYVGSEGSDNKKVHVMDIGSNAQQSEFELNDQTNAVALSHDAILFVGMNALDGVDVIQYEILPGVTPTPMTRYILPSHDPLLTGGLSASAKAVYAVTSEFVYILDGNIGSATSVFPLYSFAYNSGNISDFLVISDFNVRNITSNSADICWEYDYPATTFYLQWGEDEASLGGSNSQVEINNHGYCYTINALDPSNSSGLSPATTYYVHVKSYLESLLSLTYYAISDVINFTTLVTDATPPINPTLESQPKPDLEVKNITFTSANNEVNQNGKLSVTIINNGVSLTTSDCLVNWQDSADFGVFQTGDSYSPSRALPSARTPLNTGEEITFTWDGKFIQSGNQLITYRVDALNLLEEEDESNNATEREFYIVAPGEPIQYPDLVPSRVVEKMNPAGESYLEFYYKNDGKAEINIPEFFVGVTINGDPVSDLMFIVAGGEQGLGLVLKTDNNVPFNLDPGTYKVQFTIDPNNMVAESDENNNVYTKRIVVARPGIEDVQDTTRIAEMTEAARNLVNDNMDIILDQIGALRDAIREQRTKLKVLNKLSNTISLLTSRMQDAVNNFVTYGVDTNTKALGEGERAAVMYSYKAAYNKLPETEEELADAIKIANGRWPSILNEDAEERAKTQFQEIYKKIPNMENPNDNAAVTVMAYGLRQTATNRNLESEKTGIKTFMAIYGYHPKTTNDWNMMQAITYSGSSRGVDTDGDFLIDSREAELGTDPNNRDTDGDGFLDGVEVANGYDPLTKMTY